MKRSVCCIFVLLSLSVWIKAGDSIYVRYTLPYIDFFETSYNHPAAALWRPVRDRVTVEAAWKYRNAPDYHLIREGKSDNGFGLSADGIQRDARTAFWGSASYRSRRRNATNWTEVSDLHRIGPYQIADSIGGDVFGEEYVLSGGFTSMAGKYNWGIEAGYRASNDYRKRDPRPKTTISAPYLKVGAGIPVGNYRLGTAVSAAIYQQRLGVSTVESGRRDTYFAMKGFGMYDRLQSDYHYRFEWLYEGNSYGLSLFMLPEKGNGWIASALLLSENTESYSKSNMYPFLFRTNTVNFQAGHTQRSAYSARAIKIYGYLQQGKGMERIYEYIPVEDNAEDDTQTFYEYRLLSESGRYARDINNLKASILQEWYRAKNNTWLEAAAGMVSYTERYISPDYRISHVHLDLSAKSGIEIVSGLSSWITELKIGYRPLLASERITPESDNLFRASMAPDLEVIMSAPFSGECSVRYEYLREKVKWFLSGNLSVSGVKGKNEVTVQLTTGIKL